MSDLCGRRKRWWPHLGRDWPHWTSQPCFIRSLAWKRDRRIRPTSDSSLVQSIEQMNTATGTNIAHMSRACTVPFFPTILLVKKVNLDSNSKQVSQYVREPKELHSLISVHERLGF